METQKFEDIIRDKGCLYYRTSGVSMLPLIKENRDFVVVNSIPESGLNKFVIVLFVRPHVEGRGHYVLHRILKVLDDDKFWIVGDNCTAGEIVKRDNIIGVLTQINRKGKVLRLTDFYYLFETHVWCDVYPVRFFILRIVHFIKRCFGFVKRKVFS